MERAGNKKRAAALNQISSLKPLSALDKLLVIVQWTGEDRILNACDLSVLIFLVQRQNSATGRCDPSVECLMLDTGYKERSVRGSLSKLEGLGIIKRFRRTNWSRNQIVIFKPDRQKVLLRLKHRNSVARGELIWQDNAEKTAENCLGRMQETAPKKENGKQKETEISKITDRPAVSKFETACEKPRSSSMTVGREEFERSVVKVLTKEGSGYEAVLEIPVETFESTYRAYADEKISFSMAVDKLKEAYEEAHSKKNFS